MDDLGALTSEEQQGIYDTWVLVSKDLKGNGVQFFLRFISVHPEYQRLFHGFAKVQYNQLATNARFQAHAFTVMSSIGTLVANLEDTDVVSELLIIGQNHMGQKLTIQDFRNFANVLLQFLVDALGEACTPAAARGWKKILQIVVDKTGEGLTKNKNNKSIINRKGRKSGFFNDQPMTRWIVGILGFVGFMGVLYHYKPKRPL